MARSDTYARTGLPRCARAIRYHGLSVCTGRRELRVGVLLRTRNRRSTEPVRSGAPGSGKSADRAMAAGYYAALAAAALQSTTAQCPGAGFHRQQVRPESADARDCDIADVPAFGAL